MSSLRIVVPENFEEVGKKVNNNIQRIKDTKRDYIIKPKLIRFNNGEGKCLYDQSMRDKDVFFMSDVTNDSVGYECRSGMHYMMPDEHFQDIRRMINATCDQARKMTVVVPYLYQSRQDKRNGRESLDLAMALRDLSNSGVRELVTADVHNKSACDNASQFMPIDNFYCSDDLILQLLDREDFNVSQLMVASPDFGAQLRASFYASILGDVPLGVFHKQRDYGIVQDGLNPIMRHTFLYEGDIKGKNVIIVDDMIASGGSIIDSARKLKAMGTENVYLIATFGLFTKGSMAKFDAAYEEGVFNKLYVTNLNYVPQEILARPWLEQVDCSMKLARIICRIHDGKPIQDLLSADEETLGLINEKVRQKKRG